MDLIEKNKKEMLSKKNWAVVGVTPAVEKFGYRIFSKLQEHGYRVYGVNPKYDEVDGEKIHNSLKELPVVPDCISVVVNPKATLSMLEEIKDIGVKYVWFQPGTFNEEVIEKAEEYGLNYVYYDCVLVALDEN
ncbi:CoA-binding protein [Alkaliphilus pronyensis]|uniref:CoA-binding protein n=1 Tax=Alkaliphilus pronyensis TaxID=1482732 RepID=A0A6I0FDF7_9FIRM|nr:CoA-binding protein [Alkaliphilus pronyensis]KAB3535935.1 CoA-binding protein [Alkaliphilus pronyensis]